MSGALDKPNTYGWKRRVRQGAFLFLHGIYIMRVTARYVVVPTWVRVANFLVQPFVSAMSRSLNTIQDVFDILSVLSCACLTGCCHPVLIFRQAHIPLESDLVFIEYAINDASTWQHPMDHASRRSFERLLRKLLTYPNRPAIVLLNGFSWFQGEPQGT